MARKIIGSNWNRKSQDAHNENYKELYEGVDEVKGTATQLTEDLKTTKEDVDERVKSAEEKAEDAKLNPVIKDNSVTINKLDFLTSENLFDESKVIEKLNINIETGKVENHEEFELLSNFNIFEEGMGLVSNNNFNYAIYDDDLNVLKFGTQTSNEELKNAVKNSKYIRMAFRLTSKNHIVKYSKLFEATFKSDSAANNISSLETKNARNSIVGNEFVDLPDKLDFIEKTTSKEGSKNLFPNPLFKGRFLTNVYEVDTTEIPQRSKLSEGYRLEINGTKSAYLKYIIQLEKNKEYYLRSNLTISKYTSGQLGIEMVLSNNSINLSRNSVGTEIKSTTFVNIGESKANLIVGAFSQANLSGHISYPVLVNMTDTGLSKSQLDAMTFEDIQLLGTIRQDIKSLNQAPVFLSAKNEVQNSELNGTDYWVKNAGTPEIVTVEGINMVKAFSSGSSQFLQTLALANKKYYVSCEVKCDRFIKGFLGLKFETLDMKTDISIATTKVTNEFEKVSRIIDLTKSPNTNIKLFAGSFISADLDGYVKNIQMINLTETFGNNIPSKDYLDRIIFTKKDESQSKYEVDNQTATKNFITAMNRKAKLLGMANSTFTNPSGLEDDNHKSTAHDMSLVLKDTLNYPDLLKAWGVKKYTFDIIGANKREMSIVSTVQSAELEKSYTILGGKTGTNDDINCLVLFVQDKENGDIYFGSLLGTVGDRFMVFKQLADSIKNSKGEDTSVLCTSTWGTKLDSNYQLFNNIKTLPKSFKNPDQKLRPASTTKVLTALTALDVSTDMSEIIEIKQVDIARGSGPAFQSGDIITFKDALHLMMLPSSNTTANAVCRHFGAKIRLK
ncbi:serine hydrolase [Vagococcus vulneris]|uniref:Uncharacterized protein n=1 Tax=Vagococcus vulneris TaxID=1977869 RepID=A0A429ZWR6_9ENTE|nr:serine hydrolase [Vagococcus vulneris]RST98256.1 hypothetical protein CBF37_08045 [Vagococcus vulneris]